MKVRNSIFGIIALVTLCVIGCKKDPLFDTTEITTKQVTSITGSSAVSGGEITSDGFPTISKRGVCYGTSHEPTLNDMTAIHPNGGLGSFSVTMTDLLENTTYYVRAFAWNSTGAIYGEEYSFTTPYKPILSTLDVEEVTSVSAICGGDITDDGNARVTQRGLCWSIHENPTLDDSTTVVDSVGIGTFKSEITKLTPGTLYYVRAYATNAAGTTYGEVLNFTTQNVPVLKATECTDVTQETVLCHGDIISNAGADVTEQGFCWGTTSQPTIENEKITAVAENGLGDFSITISGLQWGTTYYVRSYATNSVGTAYGDETSFTTWTLPEVSTNSVTNITDKTVDCGGTITFDGGTPITEKGLCWSTSANSTIENNKLQIAEGENTFSGTITELTDGVTYYVRAYVSNIVGITYGEEKVITTFTLPTVAPLTIMGCYYTHVKFKTNPSVISDGGTPIIEKGLCWSTSPNPTINNKKQKVDGLGSNEIHNLTEGTTYYVRPYAINAIGIAYGDEISFTTITRTEPSINTADASNISYFSATLGGKVTDNNGADVTETGICWSTTANPTINNSKKIVESTIHYDFSTDIVDLNDGVTYYVRAYAINAIGIGYGEEKTFTTIKIIPPTVNTSTPTDISYTSATLGGIVMKKNGADVTETGVCWSTSTNPTISDSKKVIGNGLGSFTENITGLSDGVTYYVRAYATNSAGIGYGEVTTFTTTKITAPSVSTTVASNVSYTKVTLGGNVTATNGGNVTERGVCWSTSTNPTISNSKKAVGSGTGTFTANLTGLNNGVKYYYRAYATNSAGTAYGEVNNFTTIAIPKVTTTAASNISYTTVTLGGSVALGTGATATERGVCWSTSSNPTISNSKQAVGNGAGTFTTNITGLNDGVKYYVRAYAVYAEGTVYGDEKTFTTTKITVPTVTTTAASSITYTTATLGGNVTKENGATVTARGVCWSTSSNPTISNSKQAVGSGIGSFTANITGLSDGVTYYVRAYATNSKGTAYGDEKTFTTTKATAPSITTTAASNITYTTATLGGNVTNANGATVTERGVCWSTTTNPTISNNKKVIGSGTGSFSAKISELSSNKVYYVRAYAINAKGTSYGNQITFTTKDDGTIRFAFSISGDKKVYFSKGNLQYQASTSTWRFALHQYDFIGNANLNISRSYSGWIDLFGWGTSGWTKAPYSTSVYSSDYLPDGKGICNLTGSYAKADWGVYNKISNGENRSGIWRTLSKDEWSYILFTRTGASNKKSKATVNGIKGVVLLPDNWTLPNGLTFTGGASDFSQNSYSIADWNKMEANGAVFLPAAGTRGGQPWVNNGEQTYGSGNEIGHYWSSTSNYNEYNATHNENYSYPTYYLRFDNKYFLMESNFRHLGKSVRLVRDVE